MNELRKFLNQYPSRAFSLVEVLVALSIFSFVFISLVGMIPLGLTASRDNSNRLLLSRSLASVSDCLLQGPVNRDGVYIYSYPLSHKDIILSQQSGSSKTYGLLSDGTLCNESEQVAERIGTIRIEQGIPPSTSSDSSATNTKMPVYVSIAVPQSAKWENGEWQRDQESIETVLYVPYQN